MPSVGIQNVEGRIVRVKGDGGIAFTPGISITDCKLRRREEEGRRVVATTPKLFMHGKRVYSA